ncbi:MAG: sigma-70 family RNA polymerase sigma factor [Sphingobacteriales bacterium]|nr:MAG: sigma-70 family RNA polymerase sigma factor [Sphingobacteriales bacterium]
MSEPEFLDLIKTHQGMIYKICRLYRDSPEDRDDLFQEIVFQLWKGIHTYRAEAKQGTWLYRIALNTAIATFRKKKPIISYTEVLPDMADELPNDEIAIKRERLFAALKHLDDSEKAIITLYLDDFSYEQIAEVTGITENYVGVKLNRIKSKIQKLLNL